MAFALCRRDGYARPHPRQHTRTRSRCVGMMVTLGPIHGNELARRLHHVGVLAPLSSPTTSLAVLGQDERRRCPRDAVDERRDELFRLARN